MTPSHELELDYDQSERDIVSFIRNVFGASGAKGIVVGLSGGIDSSVVGALCVRAVGKEKVVGLLMPASHTPKGDTDDARQLAKSWGIARYEIPIDGVFESVEASVPLRNHERIAQANVKARVRMIFLYYFANSLSMLVAGTGDRSEESIGFFTKWGDGGADFLPIAHLYKTQVRSLGAHLGIPDRIVAKPSSPQLWPGHKATDEVPLDYDELDLVLHCLLDKKLSVEQTAEATGVSTTTILAVRSMHKSSEHKRAHPPTMGP